MRMASVYVCIFLLFTQLGDVGSAINYTIEALKVGKHITLFVFFFLLIYSQLSRPRLILFNAITSDLPVDLSHLSQFSRT